MRVLICLSLDSGRATSLYWDIMLILLVGVVLLYFSISCVVHCYYLVLVYRVNLVQLPPAVVSQYSLMTHSDSLVTH